MTLREAIVKGLKDDWTQALEDSLFWSLAEYVAKVSSNAYEKGKDDELKALREAGVIK